ncbi:hypothetical protein ACN28S_11485 [Cystobacter fuscus]
MEVMSNDMFLQTLKRMIGNRELKFDLSSAFLFNRTTLGQEEILSLLSRASLGDVRVHRDNGRTSLYSVVSRSEDLEIFIGYPYPSSRLEVTAIGPLDNV